LRTGFTARGDDGFEIVRQQRLIEIGRHDGCERHASEAAVVRAHTLDQRTLDLGVAPASDPGLAVGCDVRRGGDESRRIEGQAAGKCLLLDHPTVRVVRRVAIATDHDRIDEIFAAFGRRFRSCGA
jgi:hypothetical protein